MRNGEAMMKTPLTRGYKRGRRKKSKGLEELEQRESIEGEILGDTGVKGKLGEGWELRLKEASPGKAQGPTGRIA